MNDLHSEPAARTLERVHTAILNSRPFGIVSPCALDLAIIFELVFATIPGIPLFVELFVSHPVDILTNRHGVAVVGYDPGYSSTVGDLIVVVDLDHQSPLQNLFAAVVPDEVIDFRPDRPSVGALAIA